MALFKNSSEVTKTEQPDFDAIYQPGTVTPFSGIYVCTNCRDEIASNVGNPLPSQNHRQHSEGKGPIRWQLLVKTQRGPN